MNRKIIHVDMDAFYASVEQRDDPALRGRPVAVGGGGPRGVVAAASYEARAFGVRSAMPGSIALRKCPELLFVRPRFDVYKEVSVQVRRIFTSYTDMVEPLSLDEAYLDVTENKLGIRSAIGIAEKIKAEIYRETRLTASAGVSINKFLAKVASGMDKPNGLKVILPEEVEAFLEALPIEKFFGVGQATAQKMFKLGIRTGKELKQYSEIDLVRHFGKTGRYFYQVVRGNDPRQVTPNRVRKSVSVERTFSENLTTREDILDRIGFLASELEQRLRHIDQKGKTVTLKVRFGDFTTYTRQKSLQHRTNQASEIQAIAEGLLHAFEQPLRPVRLLGIGVSSLEDKHVPVQLKLKF